MVESGSQPADTLETERLKWVYSELVRIEQHWTDQVQNQQRRIAAVLAVNGFLVAFLSTAGIQNIVVRTGWNKYPFYGSLLFLAIGLIFGVLTLMPRIPIEGQGPGQSKNTWRRWIRKTFAPKTPTSLMDLESDDSNGPEPPTPVADPESDDSNGEDATKGLWLDSKRVWAAFKGVPADGGAQNPSDAANLWNLCESVANNSDGNLDHGKTIVRRRKWMRWEMACIFVALLLLIASTIGWIAHAV
jgi:hypothetical protein